MGKKKDREKEKEHDSPSRKKMKKHKKQKKHKKKEHSLSDEEIDVVNNDDSSQDEGKALKLKIKFGGKTVSEVVTTVQQAPAEDEEEDEEDTHDQTFNSDELPDDETQQVEQKSDEETWLDALEKGELDDTGAVKKEKDVSAMTARQRALHGEAIEGENELLQLPMYPQRNDEENEEFERKRKLRATRRKQQMEKQIEETKAHTIEKLLTKGQKTKKDVSRSNKNVGPYFKYSNNKDGVFITCPENIEFPFEKKTQNEHPLAVLCSIDGCKNIKKYACSTSKRPVCSLQCYKLINR